MNLFKLNLECGKCYWKLYRSVGYMRRQWKSTQTAGIVVIGDEVLKGQVKDTNSHFLARQLYQRGYRLADIRVVPDEVETISSVVHDFSQKHKIVLTTGGIGPTHDDVTYEAVAKCFRQDLHYHPKITKMCRDFFKTDDETHPGMKLALVPISAKLTFGTDPVTGQKALYPNVSVDNVYVFPGVPHLCERMFNMTKDILFPVVGKFYNDAIFLNVNETEITLTLNEAVAQFANVVFGSYPNFTHSYYSVKITLESLDQEALETARSFLKTYLKGIVSYDVNCFTDKPLKLPQTTIVNETMLKIRDFVSKVPLENVYLYFDGGKNSTVLLHLFSIILDETKTPVNLIYVERNKKITNFVKNSSQNYQTNLLKLNEINLKRFLSSDEKIILIKGTRRSDPYYEIISYQFSKFNTFNPLENWSYSDVWGFIRSLSLPYCELYDRGYSSLSREINSMLETTGPRKDLKYYKSAYLLQDSQYE